MINVAHLCTKKLLGAGEMVQRLRALAALPRGPEFNSQQPHGGSRPSIMRFSALFWCKKEIFKKNKAKQKTPDGKQGLTPCGKYCAFMSRPTVL